MIKNERKGNKEKEPYRNANPRWIKVKSRQDGWMDRQTDKQTKGQMNRQENATLIATQR